MAQTIKIGPLTRVEGHLDIDVTVASVNGTLRVVEARSSGTMFRGFETILKGRDPLDATQYTQRICGVCPIAHGTASSLALESAFGIRPPSNGRILRNLVLGANFLQSHVLHFYHLAALDYIDTTGVLEMSPWTPRFLARDLVGGEAAQEFVQHYVQALAIRRRAHQMGAIFGGKLPCAPVLVAGGTTEGVTAEKVAQFRAILDDLRAFVTDVYLPDVERLADLFPQYLQVGHGCGNLLAFGVFDLSPDGLSKLLPRGRYTDGVLTSLDPDKVTEDTQYSWYSTSSSRRVGAKAVSVIAGTGSGAAVAPRGVVGDGLRVVGRSGASAFPAVSPQPTKAGAYSWVKAPRYVGKVHEVGPLARMWVKGEYRRGISVIDRLRARAMEAFVIAEAMGDWLDQLRPGAPTYQPSLSPTRSSGSGFTEAPRGALGHWLAIDQGRIAHYDIVTPTAWNASPRDNDNQAGAIEQALLGTPVAEPRQPIELLRVVHSFDPCLACAVHLARPGEEPATFVVPA